MSFRIKVDREWYHLFMRDVNRKNKHKVELYLGGKTMFSLVSRRYFRTLEEATTYFKETRSRLITLAVSNKARVNNTKSMQNNNTKKSGNIRRY